MKYLSRQFKQILLITAFLFCTGLVLAQPKHRDSREFKTFNKIAGRANASFNLPDGFKELTAKPDSEYDYGLALPNQDFEIWLKVSPQTDSTPDSLYLETGHAHAKELAGDNPVYIRGMNEQLLTDYNADAGKIYFMSLPDSPTTGHYKYALLITLQKNHKGTIMALCMTNDKGPDFFKNINRAKNCIKFKPTSP